jgi:hypothetical protein
MIIYSLFGASGMMSSLVVALARKQANSLEEGTGHRRQEENGNESREDG